MEPHFNSKEALDRIGYLLANRTNRGDDTTLEEVNRIMELTEYASASLVLDMFRGQR